MRFSNPQWTVGAVFNLFCSHFLLPLFYSALPVPTKMPAALPFHVAEVKAEKWQFPWACCWIQHKCNLHEDLDGHPVWSSLSSVLHTTWGRNEHMPTLLPPWREPCPSEPRGSGQDGHKQQTAALCPYKCSETVRLDPLSSAVLKALL